LKSILSSAAVASFIAAGAASAGTVNVAYHADGVFGSPNLSEQVTVSTPGPGPELDGTFSVGMYNMTGDAGYGDFLAFCVDLAQYLSNPTVYTEAPTLFSGVTLTNINKLFDSALGGFGLGDVIDTSVESAGLQVALWEVVYDSTGVFDLDAGAFSVSGNAAVEAQAQAYLDGMATAADDAYILSFLYSATKQDIVTLSPVPLPAAGLMLLAALGGLGAAGRRRAKKARTV